MEPDERGPLAIWVCPGCHDHIEVLAAEVGHRCPARRNRWTAFHRAEAEENEQ